MKEYVNWLHVIYKNDSLCHNVFVLHSGLTGEQLNKREIDYIFQKAIALAAINTFYWCWLACFCLRGRIQKYFLVFGVRYMVRYFTWPWGSVFSEICYYVTDLRWKCLQLPIQFFLLFLSFLLNYFLVITFSSSRVKQTFHVRKSPQCFHLLKRPCFQ